MIEENYRPPPLLVPGKAPPKSAIGRWLMHGRPLYEPLHAERGHAWYQVLWLTGVDYFSTLGYQPGIALLAAGALSPIATIFLVALTLFGAFPVYAMVARKSFAGQGSIAMLEDSFSGWRAKIVVLVLLGFACTDFVITITISAADAAEHIVHNPAFTHLAEGHEMLVTLILLAGLAAIFLRGFREAIGVAMLAAIPYIVLNVIVLVRALVEIAHHGELIPAWRDALALHGDRTQIIVLSAFVFPRLALGMSGFETGVSVMPLVEGDQEGEHERDYPGRRVRATQKMLLSAALVMSILLVLSSFVTAVLVPESAYREDGPAAGRAIAWLGHKLIGRTFGTLYDVSTITILGFAGASAMTGLLQLIPRYLPRFGMAPDWIAFRRPLVLVLFLISALVTWIFGADVEAQGGAYATGVLALMLSASVAVALDFWRESKRESRRAGRFERAGSLYFWGTSAVFAYTLLDNVIIRVDGVVIASIFTAAILILGALSRAWRSTELRVSDLTFTDAESAELWRAMLGRTVHVAPLRTSSREARHEKAEEIRRFFKVEGPLAFLHVNLIDNRSEFLTPLKVNVRKEGENYVIDVFGAVAIANTIAYVSELIDPISIFLGLTQQNLMTQSMKYILWGEGETGLMVYMILVRYWRWTKETEGAQPNILLMST